MIRHTAITLAFVVGAAAFTPGLHAQPTLNGDKPALKVGDTWRWVRSDRRTGAQEAETLRTITSVAADRVEGTENQGKVVMTGDLMGMESPDWVRTGAPRFADYPLAVGKKWSFKFQQKNTNSPYTTNFQYDAEVVGIEKVKSPAGEFDAFKINYRGYWDSSGGGNGSLSITSWYAPAPRATVRTEVTSGRNATLTELHEFKLQP